MCFSFCLRCAIWADNVPVNINVVICLMEVHDKNIIICLYTVINYACIALAFVQVAVVRTTDTEVTGVYLT